MMYINLTKQERLTLLNLKNPPWIIMALILIKFDLLLVKINYYTINNTY